MLKQLKKLDYRYILLIGIPAALIAGRIEGAGIVEFIMAAIGIIPLAGFIGEATEELAAHTGPKVGGLLNATLGNAAELIITIIAIKEGILDLVIASITGSILGNLLLVMGFSILLGGLRHGRQKFNHAQATINATMLILAVVALMIPAIFGHAIVETHPDDLQKFSLGVAIIMIIIYGLGIFYSFKSTDAESPLTRPSAHAHEATWSVRKSVVVLAIATLAIIIMSELLVGSVEHVVIELGWSEFFVGIIIVPLIGNVAEHLVALQVALKNQMDLSLEIAVGSSLQIALFVAPVLVIVAAFMGRNLWFDFQITEIVALASAGIVGVFVFKDGKSNWLEGAQLLALYLILGVGFFYL